MLSSIIDILFTIKTYTCSFEKEKNFYNLWGSTTSEEEEKLRGIHKHIPAPKRPLPSHAESYNPPPEYLLDAKEVRLLFV